MTSTSLYNTYHQIVTSVESSVNDLVPGTFLLMAVAESTEYPSSAQRNGVDTVERSIANQIKAVAVRVAHAEVTLIAGEEMLLSILRSFQDTDQQFLRLTIANNRMVRALYNLILRQITIRFGYSVHIRDIDYPTLVLAETPSAMIPRTVRSLPDTRPTQEDPKLGSDDICPICREKLTDQPDSKASLTTSEPYLITTECCANAFFVDCLVDWLTKRMQKDTNLSCPLCRAQCSVEFQVKIFELKAQEIKAIM